MQVNVVVRSPSSITDTQRLILFCGSTDAAPGVMGPIDDTELGSHYVVPPYMADEQQWQEVAGETIEVLQDDIAVPAARYTRQVGALHGDLHWEPHSPAELTDMRYWINSVANWIPQEGGGAPSYKVFMHTEKPLY